jgi:Gram-negative bacterial TonB protein C-terminal
MCCKSWKSILPFAVTFLIGILGAAPFKHNGLDCSSNIRLETFQFISKAEQNQRKGTITLRLALFPSGEIEDIWVVSGADNRLIEQAIISARDVKFKPQQLNEVTTQVIYTYTLY